MAWPKIFFIRHGQTDWNAEERFQGKKDIPLNDIGRAQARRNGDVLHQWIHAADFEFVSSPLGRTRETMEIVRTRLNLTKSDYQVEERLLELSFGDWEGRTVADLSKNEPELWQERQKDKWNFVPPNGESYQMLSERVAVWLEALEKPTVVVAHGGVNRALRALFTNDFTSQMAGTPTPQDQIMMLEDGVVRWL